MPDFESSAFNHSATLPCFIIFSAVVYHRHQRNFHLFNPDHVLTLIYFRGNMRTDDRLNRREKCLFQDARNARFSMKATGCPSPDLWATISWSPSPELTPRWTPSREGLNCPNFHPPSPPRWRLAKSRCWSVTPSPVGTDTAISLQAPEVSARWCPAPPRGHSSPSNLGDFCYHVATLSSLHHITQSLVTIWPYRLTARTAGSHPANRSSILRRVTA